jgi:electron transport complex protein RnfG
MTAPSATTTLRTIAICAAIAILGCAVLFAIWSQTGPGIDANAQRYKMRHLDRLIDPDTYTNSPGTDVVVVRDPDLLGGPSPRRVFRAYRDGTPVALAIETVAPAGYSGPIRLLVAIKAGGEVAGVEVISHRETVNLGDQIERRNSDWLTQFPGRRLDATDQARWAVRRDGGDFDQFTGATVTPRAVVEAVRDALIYFETHQDELFAATESAPDP